MNEGIEQMMKEIDCNRLLIFLLYHRTIKDKLLNKSRNSIQVLGCRKFRVALFGRHYTWRHYPNSHIFCEKASTEFSLPEPYLLRN